MVANIYLGDCMEGMAKGIQYDLAIVDPPYGIGENWKKDRKSKFYKHSSTYKNEVPPGQDFFDQLFRVSENQIIWGANYYTDFLTTRNSWIVWDKDRSWKECHMSEGELAWHSFNVPLRIVKNRWNGCFTSEPRYGSHPHEKPVGLYIWQLREFAKPGNKILDTHGGSMSSVIACIKEGFDIDVWKKDAEYFCLAKKRIEDYCRQLSLFGTPPIINFYE